jgi:hypothetical protein
MNIYGVDGVIVSNNAVPLKGGTLAQIHDSCGVNVFGNTFPGGDLEAEILEPAC